MLIFFFSRITSFALIAWKINHIAEFQQVCLTIFSFKNGIAFFTVDVSLYTSAKMINEIESKEFVFTVLTLYHDFGTFSSVLIFIFTFVLVFALNAFQKYHWAIIDMLISQKLIFQLGTAKQWTFHGWLLIALLSVISKKIIIDTLLLIVAIQTFNLELFQPFL